MNYKLCRCVIFFKWFDCIKKSLYELLRRLMKLLHCCSGFLWMMFQMEKFTSSSSGFHSRPTLPCWWRWPHWCFIRYWYILHLISTGAHSRLLATRLPILKVQCEGFKGRIFIPTFKLVYDYLKPWKETKLYHRSGSSSSSCKLCFLLCHLSVPVWRRLCVCYACGLPGQCIKPTSKCHLTGTVVPKSRRCHMDGHVLMCVLVLSPERQQWDHRTSETWKALEGSSGKMRVFL